MSKGRTIYDEHMNVKDVFLYTAGGILLLSGSFLLARKVILTAKERKVEKKTLKEGSPEAYAKQFKMAFENDGYPGTNMTEFRRLMTSIPSKEFYNAVQKKYQEAYHHPIEKDISSELQSSEFREALSILAAKPDKSGGKLPSTIYLAWAKRLKAAFDKEYGIFPGTDEPAIKQVFFEIPTQSAFAKVADAYLLEYHRALMNDLSHELEFWELPEYMQIIKNKPN
jgi:hypothetical protein